MRGFEAAAVAARMTAGIEQLGGVLPRDFAELAPALLPVTTSVQPALTTRSIQQALLAISGRPPARDLPTRRLRGCLVAHGGRGIIFLDLDEPASMRFAAAHEVAHFVGHYLIRRELAVARLGPPILEVLDGHRAATPSERLSGLLKGAPLGVFTDTMDRQDGEPISEAAEIMEYEADQAAFLALAPVGSVISRVMSRGDMSRPAVVGVLIDDFGLSSADAERHAPHIIGAFHRRRPSLIEGLRAVASRNAAERHR